MIRPPLRLTCTLCALLVLTVATYAYIIKYPVTATIYNTDGSGNAVTLQSDGGNAGYAVYNNSGSLNSALAPDSSTDPTSYYQWNFSFGPSSTRSVYLTLIPVNGTPSSVAPFSGTQSLKATLYSRCFTDSTAKNYQNYTHIPYGSPDTTCGMRVSFTYKKVSYTLVMSPEETAKGYPTGAATVSCAVNASPCAAWTDVPTPGMVDSGGNSVSNVANLYNGGSSPIGQFSLTFNISLAHQ